MLGSLVFRNCVDKLLDECSVKRFSDQEVRVKVCYNSCSDNGCNNQPISASGRASRTFSKSLPSAMALLVVYVLARQARVS